MKILDKPRKKVIITVRTMESSKSITVYDTDVEELFNEMKVFLEVRETQKFKQLLRDKSNEN